MASEGRAYGTRVAFICYRETGKTSPRSFRKSAPLSRKLCHWAPSWMGNWCHRDVPSGREEFPFQSITVECPICSELRVLVKFEVKTPYASARTMRKCPNEKASKSNSARRFLWTGSVFCGGVFLSKV